MRLYEFLKDGSLFTELQNVKPLVFNDDPELNDMMLITFNGNRKMFEPIQNWTLEQMAKAIIMHYGARWDNLIKQAALQENINNRREVTETITNTETRENTRDDVGKVAAYDSDSLMANDGTTSEALEDITGDRNRTLTEEYINVENSFNTLNQLAKSSIIKTVMTDISGFMTLSIY